VKKKVLALSAVVLALVATVFIFKPYIRYDKIAKGDSSYITRTNLITGKTEMLNPYTLLWVKSSDIKSDEERETDSESSEVYSKWDDIKKQRIKEWGIEG
jgi:hypothetical protein